MHQTSYFRVKQHKDRGRAVAFLPQRLHTQQQRAPSARRRQLRDRLCLGPSSLHTKTQSSQRQRHVSSVIGQDGDGFVDGFVGGVVGGVVGSRSSSLSVCSVAMASLCILAGRSCISSNWIPTVFVCAPNMPTDAAPTDTPSSAGASGLQSKILKRSTAPATAPATRALPQQMLASLLQRMVPPAHANNNQARGEDSTTNEEGFTEEEGDCRLDADTEAWYAHGDKLRHRSRDSWAAMRRIGEQRMAATAATAVMAAHDRSHAGTVVFPPGADRAEQLLSSLEDVWAECKRTVQLTHQPSIDRLCMVAAEIQELVLSATSGAAGATAMGAAEAEMSEATGGWRSNDFGRKATHCEQQRQR
jgi:hypothetical protein